MIPGEMQLGEMQHFIIRHWRDATWRGATPPYTSIVKGLGVYLFFLFTSDPVMVK